MTSNFKNKYLKYKLKYLTAKKLYGGMDEGDMNTKSTPNEDAREFNIGDYPELWISTKLDKKDNNEEGPTVERESRVPTPPSYPPTRRKKRSNSIDELTKRTDVLKQTILKETLKQCKKELDNCKIKTMEIVGKNIKDFTQLKAIMNSMENIIRDIVPDNGGVNKLIQNKLNSFINTIINILSSEDFTDQLRTDKFKKDLQDRLEQLKTVHTIDMQRFN